MTENEIIIDGKTYVKIKIILQNLLSPKLSEYIDDLEIDLEQHKLKIELLNEKVNKLISKNTQTEQFAIHQTAQYLELKGSVDNTKKQFTALFKTQKVEVEYLKVQLQGKEELIQSQLINEAEQPKISHSQIELLKKHKEDVGKQLRTVIAQNTALKWILHHHRFTHAEIRSSSKYFLKEEIELLKEAIDNIPLETKIKFLTLESKEQQTEIERLTSLNEANSKQFKLNENVHSTYQSQKEEILKLSNEIKELRKQSKIIKPDDELYITSKLKYLSNDSLIKEIVKLKKQLKKYTDTESK